MCCKYGGIIYAHCGRCQKKEAQILVKDDDVTIDREYTLQDLEEAKDKVIRTKDAHSIADFVTICAFYLGNQMYASDVVADVHDAIVEILEKVGNQPPEHSVNCLRKLLKNTDDYCRTHPYCSDAITISNAFAQANVKAVTQSIPLKRLIGTHGITLDRLVDTPQAVESFVTYSPESVAADASAWEHINNATNEDSFTVICNKCGRSVILQDSWFETNCKSPLRVYSCAEAETIIACDCGSMITEFEDD